MSRFQDYFDRQCWNLHAQELLERGYLELDGDRCSIIPLGGPSKEELAWIRNTLLGLGVHSILDLGCNIGLYRNLFRGFRYVGVDQSENALSCARKKFPTTEFRCMDAQDLQDQEFDLVFTRAVVQHNLGQDKVTFIEAINRALKPGGYYLCHEHEILAESRNPAPDAHSIDNVRRFFHLLGFDLLEHPTDFLYLFRKPIKE